MEYKIKDRGEFFYPKTYSWIVDTFKLKCIEAIAYQMILDKGFITWTVDWFANVLGISPRTMHRMLDKMMDMGIITRYSVNTAEEGVRMRTVTVALYERTGKRSKELVDTFIERGVERIFLDYSDKRTYKRKTT
ncbi:MAG: Lrp/AsnC family transcriptional regulator [Acetobacter sp.]|nr:Lrp/AsnC family transcriptional regulator [Acetobacter sp.]